jgi:hypothetical protein
MDNNTECACGDNPDDLCMSCQIEEVDRSEREQRLDNARDEDCAMCGTGAHGMIFGCGPCLAEAREERAESARHAADLLP